MLPSFCPAPVSIPELESRLDAAQQAYAEMDPERFAQKLDVARALLLCLAEPIGRADAAWVHRLEAFDAYLDRDEARTLAALRSVFAADPSYTFPATVTPPGNPFTVLVETARQAGPGPGTPFSGPAGPDLRVDGVPTRERPLVRPYVAQRVAGTEVMYTGYLRAGEPIPQLSTPVATAAPLPEAAVAPPPVPVPWLAGAGVSAVAAGALYIWALDSRGRYDDLDSGLSPEELAALRTQTNGAVLGSIGVGALAVGLGTVAVVKLAW